MHSLSKFHYQYGRGWLRGPGNPSALADTVTFGGRKLPRYLWYMLSGAICDVAQFFIDRTVGHEYLDVMGSHTSDQLRDTISWTIAYTCTSALRQETHRIFVFGSYEGSYWVNLGKM